MIDEEIYNRYLLKVDTRNLRQIMLDGRLFLQPHLVPRKEQFVLIMKISHGEKLWVALV
jgi:hypothetical protein